MSLILEVAMFVMAVIMLIKGNIQYFFIFMGLAGLFNIGDELASIYRIFKQFEKSYYEKVLEEKTLSTLMSAARKQVDDGK